MASTGLKYHIYIDARQEFRWRLRAGNNRTIADSGEGYKNESDCRNAIELIKGSHSAPVERDTVDLSALLGALKDLHSP